jgi:hypothetical protein
MTSTDKEEMTPEQEATYKNMILIALVAGLFPVVGILLFIAVKFGWLLL